MEPPARRRISAFAAAAALLAAAGLAARRVLPASAPAVSPAAVASAPAPPRPADAPIAPPEGAAVPPEQRGYLRRLKVIEPPEPGKRGGAARDADDVAAETAARSGSLFIPAVGPVLPSGGRSSFAGNGSVVPPSPVSGPAGARQAGPGRTDAGQAPPAPGADGKRAAGSAGSAGLDLAALSSASSQALRLVARARGDRARAAALSTSPLTPAAVAEALRTQIAQDQKTDSTVRQALDALEPGSSPERQQSAVAQALSAAGAPADPEAVDQAMAAAAQPPRDPPSPAAVDDAIRQMSTNLPSADRLDELAQLAMKPPPGPNGPPPKGGVAAYQQYRDAFDRVQRENGLDPSKVVPFPAIESSFGANTGKFPLRDTLLAINVDRKGLFKPAQRAQAGRDYVAVTNLISTGDLGGRAIDQLYGSNMGAIGITQFLPTSWAAYGRSMSGGPRDPWNFRDAVLSTGNYLDRHGARTNYDKAILSYNYSADYQRKILQYGANVAPGIRAVQQNSPSPAPVAPQP